MGSVLHYALLSAASLCGIAPLVRRWPPWRHWLPALGVLLALSSAALAGTPAQEKWAVAVADGLITAVVIGVLVVRQVARS